MEMKRRNFLVILSCSPLSFFPELSLENRSESFRLESVRKGVFPGRVVPLNEKSIETVGPWSG